MFNRTYKNNVLLNYLYTFTKAFDLTQGIWMLFLASKGATLFQLGLLEGIFHVVSFIMETPTGAIADLYGRKFSRMLGRIFNIIGLLLMIFGDSFTYYLISFMILPISYNLESGAGEALIYDSLKIIGKDQQYMKYNGRIEFTYQLAGVIALLVGGIIGTLSYENVYYVAIGISALALIQTLGFKEVKTQQTKKEKMLKAIKQQYVGTYKAIKGNGRLTYLIIFSSLLGTFVTASFYYLQNYWKGYGYDEWIIGLFLGASCIGGALGGLFTHKIEKAFGEKALLKYSPFIVVAGLWGLPFIPSSAIAFILITIVEAILFVAVSDYINQLIDSERRATILSFQSMVFSFGMITVFPLFGLIADHLNITIAFIGLAVLATIMSVINYRLLQQNKNKEKYNRIEG